MRVGSNERYEKITAALEGARPWDRVVVTEGIYREAVSIDRPVEMIGLGDFRKVVIESSSDNVISVQAAGIHIEPGGAAPLWVGPTVGTAMVLMVASIYKT